MSRAELFGFVMMLMTSDDIDEYALRRHLARFESTRVTDERRESMTIYADVQRRPVSVHVADSVKRYALGEGARRVPEAVEAIWSTANILGRSELARAALLIDPWTTCT